MFETILAQNPYWCQPKAQQIPYENIVAIWVVQESVYFIGQQLLWNPSCSSCRRTPFLVSLAIGFKRFLFSFAQTIFQGQKLARGREKWQASWKHPRLPPKNFLWLVNKRSLQPKKPLHKAGCYIKQITGRENLPVWHMYHLMVPPSLQPVLDFFHKQFWN